MWLNYSVEQMKHARLSEILFNVTNINYIFSIYPSTHRFYHFEIIQSIFITISKWWITDSKLL